VSAMLKGTDADWGNAERSGSAAQKACLLLMETAIDVTRASMALQ
jgi:hypothetical protein